MEYFGDFSLGDAGAASSAYHQAVGSKTQLAMVEAAAGWTLKDHALLPPLQKLLKRASKQSGHRNPIVSVARGTGIRSCSLASKKPACETRPMVRKKQAAGTFDSDRRRQAIREAQAAVARELAKECEAPMTLPQRIADLVQELHRRLREWQ
jgi:hypothetical protein